MWVTLHFNPWDDLTHDDHQGRKRIVEEVLTPIQQTTSMWHGPGRRLLSYRTTHSIAKVVEAWEINGYPAADFQRMEFSQDRPPAYDDPSNWKEGKHHVIKLEDSE